MTSSVRVAECPFGLHKMDFYRVGSTAGLCIRRREALFAANGTYVTVTNAKYERLADCYFKGTEEDWPKAQQWLQDMLVLRSEE